MYEIVLPLYSLIYSALISHFGCCFLTIQSDGGSDNVAYEPPPPPSYTPPRQSKSDGPPSYDEAVNMA